MQRRDDADLPVSWCQIRRFSGTTRGHGSNPCVACVDERCHCGHSGSGTRATRDSPRDPIALIHWMDS